MTTTADAAPGSTCPTARSPSRSARPLAATMPRVASAPSRAAAAAASRHPASSRARRLRVRGRLRRRRPGVEHRLLPGLGLAPIADAGRHRLHQRHDIRVVERRLALDRRRRPHQRRGVERSAGGADRVQERLRRGVQHRRRLRPAAPARRRRPAPPRSRAPWRCRGRHRRSARRARQSSSLFASMSAAMAATSAVVRLASTPHHPDPEHRAVARMVEHRRSSASRCMQVTEAPAISSEVHQLPTQVACAPSRPRRAAAGPAGS